MNDLDFMFCFLVMIILARYERVGKMHRNIAQKKELKTRKVYLFDKVYWIARDHIRVEGVNWKLKQWGWYLIIWKREEYTRHKSNTKDVSIKPKIKIWLSLSEHQKNNLRMYKNKLRKVYNVLRNEGLEECISYVYIMFKNAKNKNKRA